MGKVTIWKNCFLFHCKKHCRKHIGSLHPPQQATDEISFLLLGSEAVKNGAAWKNLIMSLVYTVPETTTMGTTMVTQSERRQPWLSVTGGDDSRAPGPGWQKESQPMGTSGDNTSPMHLLDPNLGSESFLQLKPSQGSLQPNPPWLCVSQCILAALAMAV